MVEISKKRSIFIILLGGVLAASAYLHFAYFFNPLTFQQDDVTYLPWSWYKGSLQVEYITMDERNRAKEVLDEWEVRFVIAELKEGLKSGPLEAKWDQQTGKQWVNVDLRRTDDSANLLSVVGYWDQGFLFLKPGGKNPVPVKITDALKQLMDKRFAEARSMP